jgi:hypothetical protein
MTQSAFELNATPMDAHEYATLIMDGRNRCITIQALPCGTSMDFQDRDFDLVVVVGSGSDAGKVFIAAVSCGANGAPKDIQ